MAYSRLGNTEKGLFHRPEVAKEYCRTIESYIEKGYVVKKESHCSRKDSWYLLHFLLVMQDKETTKVRIVFDASAKCKEVSFNSIHIIFSFC